MVEVVFGIFNHVTLQRGTVVVAGHTQTVKLIDTLVVGDAVRGLGTPKQLHVYRQDLAGQVAVQIDIDGSCVGHIGHTHNA